MKLTPWGSFEGWSALVRSAVVWVGMEDPAQARTRLQEQSDVTAEAMLLLLTAWEQMDPERQGRTSAQGIGALRAPPKTSLPASHADLHEAIGALAGKLDTRALGTQLKRFRRRIFWRQVY